MSSKSSQSGLPGLTSVTANGKSPLSLPEQAMLSVKASVSVQARISAVPAKNPSPSFLTGLIMRRLTLRAIKFRLEVFRPSMSSLYGS